MQWFSTAQSVGYAAFALGAAAFLQKSDRRLKLLNGAQSYVYGAHFLLLDNPAAAAAAAISGTRSILAIKSRSIRLAIVFIILSLGAGVAFAGHGPGWLVVIASIAGTLAMFTLRGIPLRLVLLGGTALWLTNDILSRSIGGTMLETMIAIVNLSTIVRMIRSADRSTTAAPVGLAAEGD
jgi:hypothetical protein